MTPRRLAVAALILIIAAGILCFTLLTAPSQKTAETSSVAGVQLDGKFSLIDHLGKNVTEKSWPGQYTLVFFGFTHCPSVCPTALQKISDVMDKIGTAEPVQPLFITTDPDRDDVAQMARYVSQFHHKIIGLTGNSTQIKAAINAYKIYAAKVQNPGENDYIMDHSSFTYLMSPQDQLVAIFKSEDSSDKMAQIILEKTQNTP